MMNRLLKLFKSVVEVGETKMVILVRTDLQMGQGKIAAQCAHVAVMLCHSTSKLSRNELRGWLANGQPKIVLKVSENSEATLRGLYQQALEKKLNVCLIYDAGRTQVERGTLTALGIGPNSKADIDSLTTGFKLL